MFNACNSNIDLSKKLHGCNETKSPQQAKESRGRYSINPIAKLIVAINCKDKYLSDHLIYFLRTRHTQFARILTFMNDFISLLCSASKFVHFTSFIIKYLFSNIMC